MDTDEIVRKLEPYRGQRRKLKDALGDEGLRMLHSHPAVRGSPTFAARFLGYSERSRGRITNWWRQIGLRTVKADYAAREREVADGFRDGMTLDDWEKSYLKQTSRIEAAPVFEWRVKRGTEYGILCLVGDLHYGSDAVDIPRWLKLRDWIAQNPDVRWVGLGDFLNCATATSPGMQDFLPYDVAVQLLIRHLRPIAAQGYVLLDGNHEERLQRALKLRISPMQGIAKELGLHYGMKSELVRLRITDGKRSQEYDGYLHHGYGSARTQGGRINKLVQTMQGLDVDFIAMGHVHQRIVTEQVRVRLADLGYTDRKGQGWADVETDEKPLVFSGSYLRYLRGSYPREAGMPPAALGSTSLHFYLPRHACHGRK